MHSNRVCNATVHGEAEETVSAPSFEDMRTYQAATAKNGAAVMVLRHIAVSLRWYDVARLWFPPILEI